MIYSRAKNQYAAKMQQQLLDISMTTQSAALRMNESDAVSFQAYLEKAVKILSKY